MPFTFHPALWALQLPHVHSHSLQLAIHTQLTPHNTQSALWPLSFSFSKSKRISWKYMILEKGPLTPIKAIATFSLFIPVAAMGKLYTDQQLCSTVHIHSENNLDWFYTVVGHHPDGKWNCQLQLFTRAEPTGDITCWYINYSSRLFARERTELLIELWEVFVVMIYTFL